MTEDTIFDLASLTKSVATTTAFLQLYEKGLVRIDEPVQTYLPDFNPTNDPRRAQVTLRMLLTHTSGIAGDLSLDGPWGLDRPTRPKAFAVRSPRGWCSIPVRLFHYSDINFILVGAIIEKITGEPLDTYVPANVFAPLGMSDTRYLPAAKACGPHQIRGPQSLSVRTHPGWASVRQVRGAPRCWRASHRRRMTTTLRASTPTTTTCFAVPCMTRRHDAWAEWPAVPGCSRRRQTSAGTPRRFSIASPAARARSR